MTQKSPDEPDRPLLTSARRTPPPRPRSRLSPLDLAAALLVPVVLAVVLVTLIIVPFDGRSSASDRGDGQGADGVGDPYFPGQGGEGFDVQHYDVDLRWDGRVLEGRTTVTAVATEKLDEVHLDLELPAESAQVDGRRAQVHTRGADDLVVEPDKTLQPGATFTVVVGYGGDPGGSKRSPEGSWWRDGDTVTAAGEPYSAAWWFPANDHPSDPATMDVVVTVPRGVEALSVGTLVSRDERTDPQHDTWHWRTDRPVVTYISFLSIGQYEIRTGTTKGAMTQARPYLYAVSEDLPDRVRRDAFVALAKTPRWVGQLEKLYGPYPMREIGGIVPPHRMDFAGLETAERPVYSAPALDSSEFQDELITHEMAHMWFGDTVTLRRWSDLFLNEGYASHAAWLVAERTGGQKADRVMRENYDGLDRQDWKRPLDDPGADTLFDTIYERGPMALQALRNLMGDDAFLAFSREWATHAGPQSIDDWYADARRYTRVDLTAWHDAWITGTTKPAPDKAIGFR